MELRLHADDLKSLEDTFARAMMRGMISALRMAAKEGLLTGLAAAVPQDAPEPVAAAPPEPIETPPQTGAEPPQPPHPTAERRTRRSLKEVLRTVAHRPEGFVTSDRAYQIIGTDTAPTILRTWIFERTVRAVIVAEHHGTPTKGLPGRLHVETSSLRERNLARLRNLDLPGALRKTPPPLPDLVVN